MATMQMPFNNYSYLLWTPMKNFDELSPLFSPGKFSKPDSMTVFDRVTTLVASIIISGNLDCLLWSGSESGEIQKFCSCQFGGLRRLIGGSLFTAKWNQTKVSMVPERAQLRAFSHVNNSDGALLEQKLDEKPGFWWVTEIIGAALFSSCCVAVTRMKPLLKSTQAAE